MQSTTVLWTEKYLVDKPGTEDTGRRCNQNFCISKSVPNGSWAQAVAYSDVDRDSFPVSKLARA